jgi:hypothetical protein
MARGGSKGVVVGTMYNTETNRTCPLRDVLGVASGDGLTPPLFIYLRLSCGHWDSRYACRPIRKKARCLSCRDERRP